MPNHQHEPGVETVNRQQPDLRGATNAPVLSGHFGGVHPGETRLCADADSLYRDYLPSVTIDGHVIPLDKKRRPLPAELVAYLAELPDSPLRALAQLRADIESASDERLLGMLTCTKTIDGER